MSLNYVNDPKHPLFGCPIHPSRASFKLNLPKKQTPPAPKEFTAEEHRAMVSQHLKDHPVWRGKFQGRHEVWYRSWTADRAVINTDCVVDVFAAWGCNNPVGLVRGGETCCNREVSRYPTKPNGQALTVMISSPYPLDDLRVTMVTN